MSHFDLQGVKGDEIFVFCHGATGSGYYWRLVAPILNELGHTTLLVDMPGHGLDYTAEIGDLTMDDYARRVADIVSRQNKPVILVGHSMGGGVITSTGELCPDRVKKLIYVTAHMPLPGNSMNGLTNSLQPIDWRKGSEDGKTVPNAFMSLYRGTGERPQTHTSKVISEANAKYGSNESLAVLSQPLRHTRERWGTIPRFYIQTMQDADLWTSLQQEYIDYWGCRAVYRVDSDHSIPCAAPTQLAFILHDIATERWEGRQKKGSKYLSFHGAGTAVLVNGQHTGAWVWEKVLPVLNNMGYDACTLDPFDNAVDFQARLERLLSLASAPVTFVGYEEGARVLNGCLQNVPPERVRALFTVAAANAPALPFEQWPQGRRKAACCTYAEWRAIERRLRPDACATRLQEWKPLKKVNQYAVCCTQDTVCSPDAQADFFKQQNFNAVYGLDTDHFPQISCPAEFCYLIHSLLASAPCSEGFYDQADCETR